MIKQEKTREEVLDIYKWDLSSIYKNEKEALIVYVPETGHIYGEHVALLKDIK